MPLKRYGVLVGRPLERRWGSAKKHYRIRITDGAKEFRCAVRVRSKLAPGELQYVVKEDFDHDILERLAALPMGFHELTAQPGGGALDFIRGDFFRPDEARILPPTLPGPDNDLNDQLDRYLRRAMADEEALIYAFGEPWGLETAREQEPGGAPWRGIHGIHQNQGNVGPFTGDDGVWQDGGILLRFRGRWVAIFLRFQDQAWQTDDSTGRALDAAGG